MLNLTRLLRSKWLGSTKRPPHDALRQPGLGTFVIPKELLQKTIPRELTQNTNSLDLERNVVFVCRPLRHHR